MLKEALNLELVPKGQLTVSDLKSNHELDKLLLPARAVRDIVNKSAVEDSLAQFNDEPKDSNQSVLVIVDHLDQNEDEEA